MMKEKESSIYQSGQSVIIAGIYEAVGVDQRDASNKKELAIVELSKGELFPNYEGRAISWRLVERRSSDETSGRQ